MWFRVCLCKDRCDLNVLIAADGRLYFDVQSVGKFLGFKCPRYFTKTYGSRSLTEVRVPREVALLNEDCRLFAFRDVIFCFRTVKKRNHYFNPYDFFRLWIGSYVTRPESIHHSLFCGEGPRVVATKSGLYSLQHWIRTFGETVVMRYLPLQEDAVRALMTGSDVTVPTQEPPPPPPPSLASEEDVAPELRPLQRVPASKDHLPDSSQDSRLPTLCNNSPFHFQLVEHHEVRYLPPPHRTDPMTVRDAYGPLPSAPT